ncbi:MAG: flavodoxin family protein [Saprospiraceae bacterium]
MKSVLFLLASSRIDGNAELLAREAAKQLPGTVEQHWVRLSEFPLDAFEDVRHEGERTYEMPTGNAKELIDLTLAADHIVFAAPVYWYSMPAPAKLYLDHWSHWMRVPGLDFRKRMSGKTIYLTSAMAGDDAHEVQPLIQSLQLTASYLGMEWGGHVLAHANAAGDVLQQSSTLRRASVLLGGS